MSTLNCILDNNKRYNISLVRKHCPGYIGGKRIAKKATDNEVVLILQLQDKISTLHNRHIAPINREIIKIQNQILKRKEK
jgi:hypothetical protein